jgi:hypothetical protein
MSDLDSKNLQHLTKMLTELNREFEAYRESGNPVSSDVLDNIRKTEEIIVEINKIERQRATSFGRKLLSENSKTI